MGVMALVSRGNPAAAKLSARISWLTHPHSIGAPIANLVNEVSVMLNIKHILFPVDFSERCCSAVPFVESIAKHYGAKITLLTAMQPMYYGAMGDPFVPVGIDTEELWRGLKERLDTSLTKEFGNLRVERYAELGDPAYVVTHYARTHGVDLIMMPTHGYGPFRRLLLGSVTAKVLHDAQCPVWTAAHVAERPCRDHITCRNILCAVDTTANSVSLMKWVNEFAKETGATVRMVHVVPGTGGLPSRQMNCEFQEAMRKEARQAIERLEGYADLKAPLCVTDGNVAESVSEEARRHKADLVVIGRGTLHETLGRLRTHAYGIIRQSPCPVLSV
jgi:nucleotide-binding universal stress UspA family protein